MRKSEAPVVRNRKGRIQATCKGCGVLFETILSQLGRRNGGKFGGKFHSKACWFAWRARTRQTRLAKLLKQQYGMTEVTYFELLRRQGGVCGVCRRSPGEDGPIRLVVDHDHVTGRVRGLLCWTCNLGLGNFKDDPSLLASAIKYLARPSDT